MGPAVQNDFKAFLAIFDPDFGPTNIKKINEGSKKVKKGYI